MMDKSPVDIRKAPPGAAQALSGAAGLAWEALALVFPRLRQTQITLARRIVLDGEWESAPRGKPLPLKRRQQFARVDALDGRRKFGWHPEGEALRLIRVEGVKANGEAVALAWSCGTNTWSNFSLPFEARGTRLTAIRIKSDLGIPVKVRWLCDDVFIK